MSMISYYAQSEINLLIFMKSYKKVSSFKREIYDVTSFFENQRNQFLLEKTQNYAVHKLSLKSSLYTGVRPYL